MHFIEFLTLFTLGLTLDSLRQPYWYDGKKVRYTAWKAGEPNESYKQCGRIWSDGWADAICSGSFSVYPFCEKGKDSGFSKSILIRSRIPRTRLTRTPR